MLFGSVTNNNNNSPAAAAAGKVATKKTNSMPNNNELRYATLTITPPSSSSSLSSSSLINNNVSVSAIQHGETSSNAGHLIHIIPLVSKAAKIVSNDTIPLTVISHKSNIKNSPSQKKIDGKTLPTNIVGGISKGSMSQAVPIPLPCSSNAAVNGSSTVLLRNDKLQKPVVAATVAATAAPLQRVPIASDGGDASLIARQLSLNGSIPVPESIISNESHTSATLPLIVYDQAAIIPNNNNKSLSDMVTECILPDNNNDMKTSADEIILQNVVSDRSNEMLIIDDSSDDEDQEKNKLLNVRHISNSVVLTKAKSSDIRFNGTAGQRNLKSDTTTANVVLMKIPNTNASTKTKLEIPIVNAFSLANNNNIKIISPTTAKYSQNTTTILMRSNSVPSPVKSLSPRSAKRCQSLNNAQPSLQQQQQQQQSQNLVNTLNPVKTSIHQIDLVTSADEPNKENNDISLIELDDSMGEDISEVNSNANEQKDTISHEENVAKISTNPDGDSLLENTATAAVTAVKEEVKDDQKIAPLICNENTLSSSPNKETSSSSSALPIHLHTSNGSSNNVSLRQILTPRRIIDTNVSSQARRLCRDSSIASALSMVSTFDMLHWKEDRIASARGTNMRFELNEFNLLQVHERGCPPRYRIHTPYEQPIYERFRHHTTSKSEQGDPLLYLCRTCKLYGPAVDFLAPEFCSYECLKRTAGKRALRDVDMHDLIEKKRSRKSAPTTFGPSNKTFGSNSNVNAKPLPTFRWNTYLANMRNVIAAPIDLFLNPFPTGPNPFSIGMKVEAIDPENCSLFCVCTIVQIQGYRLRLNYDGYNSIYDFWVNADSMDIFPPGWCAKTNRILQPPRGYEAQKFDWHTYLKKTNSIGADKKLFTHLSNASSMANRNPFTVGMFLEADDLNDTGKLCVASVADVLDERIRVHFDGWDDCYDYWVDISSPYIHPCGWHEGRQQLLVPPEYNNASFSWRDYIRDQQGLAAPTDFFVPRDPIEYRPGMKLEVVDPRNPCLIRPATVIHHSRHRVKIHLDCWDPEYIFCLEDDSPDLHPIGWCDATGHELEPPPGYLQRAKVMPCNTFGCRGIGNIDRTNGLTHATRDFCPYVLENWRSKNEKIPRVDGKEIIRKIQQHNEHDDSTVSSIQKLMKRACNQTDRDNSSSLDLIKATEKLLKMPYKQPTRGRPRNCDRLAAAAAAAAAVAQLKQQFEEQQQQQQQQQQNRQNMANTDIELKKEPFSKSNSVSTSTSPIPSPQSQSQSLSQLSATATATAPAPSITHQSNLDAKITVAKRFLCDYGPRLQQNYKLWRKNAIFDIASKVQRNPLYWSTDETCTFLNALLNDSCKDFHKHDINGAALLMLQQQDLTEILQFKLGPAIKLCEIILQLRMVVVTKYKSSLTVKVEVEVEDKKNENTRNSDTIK